MTHKRIWAWLALMGTAAMLLAACGGPPAQTPPTAAPAAEATEAPAAATEAPVAATEAPVAAPGGKLTILYWQAVTTLNPQLSSGTKDFDGATPILEPLARYSEMDELVPYLAAEIPTVDNGGVAADGTSVTWKLVDTVWSDGTPFTADDVIFTYEYCVNPETGCVNQSNYTNIDTIEALDPHTVQITWKTPTANPHVAFTAGMGMIIQKAQFESCIGAAALSDEACQAANIAPVGTGPYMVKEFKPGDTVLYAKNPQYRNADTVFFDEVEIKGGGDAASAARAVCETGEADFAWNIQVPDAVLKPILAGGNCDPVAGGSFGIERIVVNFTNPDPDLGDQRSEPDQPHPFLTDPAVRQAINLAIDREAIVNQLQSTAGSPTCNILVAPAVLDSPNTSCDHDVEAAKKLLDAAGWVAPAGSNVREKDGVKLIATFQTSVNILRQGEQAIIKSNLAEIGIQVNLKAIDASVFFGSDPGNPDTLGKFYADLEMYSHGPSSTDPESYFKAWICEEVASSANQWHGANSGRYCSQEYDALFAEFQTTLDPTERAELAIALNDKLIADNAIIPLVNRVTPLVKLKNLDGPTYTSFDSVLWNIQDWKRTS